MDQLLLGLLLFLGVLLFLSFRERKELKGTIEKMSSSIAEVLSRSQQSIDAKLDTTTKYLLHVQHNLGEVKSTNRHIHELGKDISSLSDILKSPKLRGNLGEYLLEELLHNYFNKKHYAMQHGFKDGQKVDAALFLHDEKILSIDAKFPLENFEKYLHSPEEQQDAHYKMFIRDVKKHISSISEKYIRPNENTLPFALMYIPAENVYYELIASGRETDLTQFAFEKNVIPVSPSTLFSYIQILLIGFKGMEIEEHAETILKDVEALEKNILGFEEHFDRIGKHIGHAASTFDTAKRSFEKTKMVSTHLGGIAPKRKKKSTKEEAKEHLISVQ